MNFLSLLSNFPFSLKLQANMAAHIVSNWVQLILLTDAEMMVIQDNCMLFKKLVSLLSLSLSLEKDLISIIYI